MYRRQTGPASAARLTSRNLYPSASTLVALHKIAAGAAGAQQQDRQIPYPSPQQIRRLAQRRVPCYSPAQLWEAQTESAP